MNKTSSPSESLSPNSEAWHRALNRAMLDSALDCIITMDANGRVLEFNPAAERVFGYTRADAIGRELADLIIPPSFRQRHLEGLQRYLRSGDGPVLGRRLEVNALRSDGSEILVELAITAFHVEENPVFTAYLRDITGRKKGEDANRRLAAIIESSSDAIISKNLDSIIQSWNQAAETLFGYKPEEVIGKSITILIPADRQSEELEILQRIRHGERVEHYETVRQRKDGSLLNISLTVSPIRDESGTVIGASKIARDITERIRGEKRRDAQYAVASLLAASSSLNEIGAPVIEAIAASGNWIAGSIWLCEQNCESLRCAATWHVGGEALEEFQRATINTPLANAVGLPGRVVNSKKPTWISDLTLDTNFPRAAIAQRAGLCGAFAFPLRARGKIAGVLELFSQEEARPDEDLIQMAEALGNQLGLFIHRQQIDDELQKQKEEAESANAAKDRFLATLSHELRTPLTPVLIWAGGMIREPGLAPDLKEGLRMVCRNVELEARLIDDLLDLTRITRGKFQMQLLRKDLHELLRQALDIVRDDISARHQHLSVELNATSHFATVDSSRLQQVFWNLLKNASKFSPEGGTITVRTTNSESKKLIIEISDTGIGIEPENLESVFDAFVQIGNRPEGLGLGLAISKAVVEMHDGVIRAISEGSGKGATFLIELATID
jgi:two-component system CheB/CheR fusion protein